MQSVPSTSFPLSTTSVKGASYALVGRSRAGDGTTFVIPQLKWMFDCGALVEGGGLRQPRTIFLTHTHSDHIFTLAHYAYSREQQSSSSPLSIYVPQRALPLIQTYLDAYERLITMDLLDSHGDDNSDSDTIDNNNNIHNSEKTLYQLIGMAPGQELSLARGGKSFEIRVIECVHRVDCLGYSIFEKQQKLKDEYKGLPGKEIGQLKKEGAEITTSILKPFLCYLGDTTARVFEKHPEVLQQHSIIVVECSFIDEASQDNAIRTKHMHWSDLKPIVEENPQVLFVLIHFSLRYSVSLLRDFFRSDEEVPNNNVHPMLIQHEIIDDWSAKKGGEQGQKQATPGCDCFVCQPATKES